MRLNKKSARNPSEHLELEEESSISRDSRSSRIRKPRGVKSGVGNLLNVEVNSDVSEDLDEIKF